jgi:hypothetical protein
MPSVAKIWNRRIVGSAVFIYLCSKLRISNFKDTEPPSLASDIKEAKAHAIQKRKKGPFSLPSFLTSGVSIVSTSSKTEQPALDTFRADLEKRIVGPTEFSLHLNDPSNYTERPGAV